MRSGCVQAVITIKCNLLLYTVTILAPVTRYI